MLDMNKRIKFLGVVLTGVCSLMLSGCSNNDEPRQQEEFVLSDPAQGYFLTPCGTTASRTLEAGGGEVDIPLASSMTEQVIPIHMIAPEKDMFRDSGKWGGCNSAARQQFLAVGESGGLSQFARRGVSVRLGGVLDFQETGFRRRHTANPL